MKKKLRKMSLRRETLRKADLRNVAGACSETLTTTAYITCPGSDDTASDCTIPRSWCNTCKEPTLCASDVC